MTTDKGPDSKPTSPEVADDLQTRSQPDEGTAKTEHHSPDRVDRSLENAPQRDEETAKSERSWGARAEHAKAHLVESREQAVKWAGQAKDAVMKTAGDVFKSPDVAEVVLAVGAEVLKHKSSVDVGLAVGAGKVVLEGVLNEESLGEVVAMAGSGMDSLVENNKNPVPPAMEAMGRGLAANVGVDHLMQDGVEWFEQAKQAEHDNVVASPGTDIRRTNAAIKVQQRQWRPPADKHRR
jgi:hypothetical protein